MKHAHVLKNVAVISLGAFVAKGIGALYRIPLTGMLGGYGMGLYQMAYPLFCVLLTFSSAGIPSALSRMVAREAAVGRDGSAITKVALRLFALLGLAGSALMVIFAPAMSGLQGDGNLTACYFALAPSVFLVAVIAVLRGYFQGKDQMAPTALSEIIEQVFKAAVGLFFALRHQDDPPRAVAGALAAVTLSELAAVFYLWNRYRAEPRKKCLFVRQPSSMGVLFSVFPVMAAAALLPLSQMADSILIVRLLSRHTQRAVSLYGLFAGGAASLVGLPACICYGLVAATVPAVSSRFAHGDKEGGRERAMYSLLLTLAFCLPCAAGLFFLARPAVNILYSSLSAADKNTLVSLIRLSSVSAATLAGIDTLSACLTGMGRAKYAARSMLVAVLVKFLLQWLLVPTALSIFGAAIAANACYLVAFFLDLFYTVKKDKVKGKSNDYDYRIGNGEGGFDPKSAYLHEGGPNGAPAQRIARVRGLEGGGHPL